MRYRLVATDIDGTLLNRDHLVPDSARQAIQRLQAGGVPVVLTTARPPAMIRPIHQDLGMTGPIIACTGALIFHPHTGETLAHRPMAKDLALAVVAAVRSVDPAINLAADLETEWHIDRIDDRVGRRIAGGMVPLTGGLERTLPTSERDVTCLSFRVMEARPAIEEAIRRAGLDRQVHITSAGGVVDIVAQGVHKGAALQALAAILGIPVAQTLAIGDDENDIPLLRAAGLGVAMGNAADEVKAVAGAVTRANWEDGWAAAMERYVFPS